MKLDEQTLRNAVGHCSQNFQQELRQAAQRNRVSVEVVMRDRLLASLEGRPPRYVAGAAVRLAVDNS